LEKPYRIEQKNDEIKVVFLKNLGCKMKKIEISAFTKEIQCRGEKSMVLSDGRTIRKQVGS
jgi:hypothetical protein